MNFKISFSILFLFLILILISCDDSPTEPNESKELWPFKIGNQWVWKYTAYDTLGNVRDLSYDTLTVVGTMICNGNQCYLIETSDNDTVMFAFFGERLNRVYEGDNGYEFDQLFKYPVKSGETFFVRNDSMQLCTVKSLKEQVVCPSGKYSTIKYELSRKYEDDDEFTVKEYSYFCPGVGLVRDELIRYKTNNSPYITTIIELQSYRLK